MKKRPQADQKSSKKLVSILIPFLMDLGTNLARFWRVLAAKLEPSWDQMPPKPDPKNNQKNDHLLGGLRIDFGWILGPSWGVPG